MPTEAQVEAGAKALRSHRMAGRTAKSWAELDKFNQETWRGYARVVLAAAEEPGGKEDKSAEGQGHPG